jgi:uncharacterized protein
MRIARIFAICSLALVPSLAAAQPSSAPPRPADASAVTEAEIALAMEMVELMDVQGLAMSQVRGLMDQEMEAQPELAPFRGILEDWVGDIFSSPEAAQAFARLYAESFTEAELRGLIEFYNSPLGKRVTAEQSIIGTRAEEIGQALAEAHAEDLRMRLEKAMTEQENKRSRSN